MLIVKLLKLPLKLIAIPAALCLFICHIVCVVLIGISSFVTSMASSLFLFGAAIEWIAGAPAVMAYQCLGLGLFFLIAPHIANWLVGKVADLLYSVLGFITF